MTVAMWILLLIAILCANSPFLTTKLFGIKVISRKHFGHYLLEWSVGLILVAALAYVFEAQTGPVHAQDWEFFVIGITLYAILAFPALVWRYFWSIKSPN